MGDGLIIAVAALSLTCLCYFLQRLRFNFFISVGLTFMAASFIPMFFLVLAIFFGSPEPDWLRVATDFSMISWLGFFASIPLLILTPTLKNYPPGTK